MTENTSRKMVNLPVFPSGSEKSGVAGGEGLITSPENAKQSRLANVNVEAFDKEYMTSLEIAEVTGKKHAHVMRDIRAMVDQGVSESNFGLWSYKQEQPKGGYKDVSCYRLTKKGCLILASGYNAVLREKIINRWEELEKKEQEKKRKEQPEYVVPKSFPEALMLAYNQAKQIEAQQLALAQKQADLDKSHKEVADLSATITQMQPKATYYDMILENKSTVKVTQIAQDYGMSAQAFNKLLCENKLQRKVGEQWILYRQFLDKGYVHSKPIPITHHDGSQTFNYLTVWTQKGRIFLYEFLKKLGVIPMIERDVKSEAHDK